MEQKKKRMLILTIIEFGVDAGEISECQKKVIFYIGEIIKVNKKNIW